jgi:hypothetical protein
MSVESPLRSVRLLAAALLAGCGSLADGDYRGEVLLEMDGQVLMDGSLGFDSDLGVAVHWSRALTPEAGAQSVVVATEFPANYSVQFFHPPAGTTFIPLFGEEGLNAAVGEIVVFEDVDGDDRWSPDREPVMGGSFDTTLLWVQDAQSERLAPNGGWTPKEGFNLVRRIDAFSCINPWELWLEELVEPRTDLYVGANWALAFDWDCDGQSEPGYQVDEQFGCPGTEALIPECEYLQQAASNPDGSVAVEQGYLLQADPVYLECLNQVCPEVVGPLLQAASGAMSPPQPPSR